RIWAASAFAPTAIRTWPATRRSSRAACSAMSRPTAAPTTALPARSAKGNEMAAKDVASRKQSAAQTATAVASGQIPAGETPADSLIAEIAALRDRLDAVLEQETRALYQATPGVPLEVCHQLLTRGDGCLCRIVQRLMKDKEPALPAQ